MQKIIKQFVTIHRIKRVRVGGGYFQEALRVPRTRSTRERFINHPPPIPPCYSDVAHILVENTSCNLPANLLSKCGASSRRTAQHLNQNQSLMKAPIDCKVIPSF